MAVNIDPKTPAPCEVLEVCPICGGLMEAVYSRAHQKVCVCIDCHTSITVPDQAWDAMRGRSNDPRR
jgi:hypothetical protein